MAPLPAAGPGPSTVPDRRPSFVAAVLCASAATSAVHPGSHFLPSKNLRILSALYHCNTLSPPLQEGFFTGSVHQEHPSLTALQFPALNQRPDRGPLERDRPGAGRGDGYFLPKDTGAERTSLRCGSAEHFRCPSVSNTST